MAHCDDDIALFVPLLDIAMRLDDLLQREAPINNGLELLRIDQLGEGQEILYA